MNLKRRCLQVVGAALVLMATSGPRLLPAQEDLDDGCKFRTRWKDAYGFCKACCNSIENSCPCTV